MVISPDGGYGRINAYLVWAVFIFFSLKGSFIHKPWLLKFAMIMIPAPWIAIEAGWFVAEYGRQPWTVYGILPTHLSVSNIDAGHVILSLAGFVLFLYNTGDC